MCSDRGRAPTCGGPAPLYPYSATPPPPKSPLMWRPGGPDDPRPGAGADVLVVVEDVLGVVRGLYVHQPVIDGVAVRLADPARIFVAAEEVNIDAFAEAAEGSEEPPRPGSVLVAEVLAGPPHSVEGDRVGRLPAPKRCGAFCHSAHRSLQMEHRRVGPRRRAGVRVLGEHVDEIVTELGEMSGLPVVVPTVDDGRVECALESHVRRGPDEVEEGRPGCAERAKHPLTVLNRAGVAGTDHHHWAPVQMLGDDR